MNPPAPPLEPLFKPVATTEEEHRRQHGMGRLSVLDTDAELAAIAARFPPGRRSSLSGLNRWLHRQCRLATTAGS